MTRDEAGKIILQRLGDRVDDTRLQEALPAEMKLVQETALEQADFKPWFLLSQFMSAETGIDESRLPLPEMFLEEHEDGALWLLLPGTTKYVKLEPGDADFLEEKWSDQKGQPKEYAVVNRDFILFPQPNAKYKIRMRCFLRQPQLTYAYGAEVSAEVKTNAWLTYAPDWLIGEVGAILAGQYTNDQERAAKFQAQAAEAKTRIYHQHVAREEMNRRRLQGED